MWKIVLLFVAVVGVSADENITTTTCIEIIEEECDFENRLPDDVPGTKEEFENACSLSLGYFMCANRILENCDPVTDLLTDHFELERVVKRICDKDYVFYDALIESLPCAKKNRILITSCPTFHGERKENFVNALAEIGIDDFDPLDFDCSSTLFNIGCYASNTGKICSNKAKDVLLDILQGFDEAYGSCPPDVKEKLRSITEVIDTNIGEGDN